MIILSNSTSFVLEKMIVLEMALYKSNQELIDELTLSNSQIVICPSPLIADKLRNLVQNKNVITISKWVSDKLGALDQKKIKKADLLIKLASVWQNYNKDASYSKFKNHFDIFTELRSYSLDLGLLSDILADYDEDLRKSVYLFWALLNAEKIIDEQLAYKIISEQQSTDSISLVGFKFLNGIQVDMLKNLSNHGDVRVYLPEQLNDQLFNSDWPLWILPQNQFIKIGKNVLGEEINPSRPRFIFPRGKSSEIVEIYSKKFKENSLVLGTTKINYEQVQEVVQDNHFFKLQTDLFFEELQNLKESLSLEVKNGTFSIFEELEEWLISKGTIYQKESNFLGFKIIQLSRECTENYKLYYNQVNSFLIELINEVVQLNAPRIFRISLKKDDCLEVLGLDNLIFWQENNPITLLVNSSFGGLTFSEKKMSESLMKAIRSISPIRRMGLEYSFLKIEIQQALRSPGSLLLIDSETLEYDYTWSEALKDFHFVNIEEVIKFKKKEFKVILPKKEFKNTGQTYTASKLQNYLDCPQKYYYTYIESLEHSPSEKVFLSPSELGAIEHKIIEKYFNLISVGEFDEVKHVEIVKNVFNEFLITNKITLSTHAKVSAESEAMNLSQNGIKFILELIQRNNFKKIQFELEIPTNDLAIKGSIDCLITLNNDEVILIDLKRSSTAIGSKRDTETLKKIQLWVYALCLMKSDQKIHSMGYVCLKDPDKKSLFIKNDEIEELLYSRSEEIENVMRNLIKQVNTDVGFQPMPLSESACKYCHVSLVCTRGQV